MISICIPIYNYDVRRLVEALAIQIAKVDIPCELVLIDDGSSERYRQLNREVCEQFRYIQLSENIGRSRIRNLFPEYANYEYLLFLDCDSIVENPEFLRNYLDVMGLGYLVACGGRIYPNECPDDFCYLSWRFGVERESQPAEIRQRHPNRSFMTNNFMIHRSLMNQISFDESLVGYGHEDTLFGFMLKRNGVRQLHINNPILNGDIESNLIFLEKTERGVENLCRIAQKLEFDSDFVNDVSLLNAYVLLRKYRIKPLFFLFFVCFKPALKSLLGSRKVSLRVFDIYKLGLLIECCKRVRL